MSMCRLSGEGERGGDITGVIAKWRRPYRKRHTLRRPPLSEEALTIRAERRLEETLRAALRGDIGAFIRIAKLTGDLPANYKSRY